MLKWCRSLIFLFAAVAATPVLAAPSSCPEGVDVQGTAVASVSDIFRIREGHRGQQVNFVGLEIANANFSGRDVSNLCFSDTKLSHSNWSGATGHNLQFHGADLTGSTWNRFKGERLNFFYSNLSDASLANAEMRLTKFDRTKLAGVDASQADLSGGSLQGSALDSLKQARFDFANLAGFEFRCGIGQGDNCGQYSTEVSFVGADLTGAAILMAHQDGWNLSDAILDNTRVHFFQLQWIRESKIEGRVIVEPTAWTPARYEFSERLRSVSLSPEELLIVWRAFDRLNEPDFDCSKATSPMEKYICNRRPYDNRSSFSGEDRELNQAYIRAWRKDRSIVADQRQWLRKRDACMQTKAGDYGRPRDNCIRAAYRERIEELWRIAGMESVLESGERQLFVDQQTGEFLWQIESSALRSKLAPIAFGNSWELIAVERDKLGRIKARGSGIGPNYHMADLRSPENGMTYGALSGFYGGIEPCLPNYDVCPIVRFRGFYLDAAPESVSDQVTEDYHFNNFITSGARAGFSRLVALPVEKSRR